MVTRVSSRISSNVVVCFIAVVRRRRHSSGVRLKWLWHVLQRTFFGQIKGILLWSTSADEYSTVEFYIPYKYETCRRKPTRKAGYGPRRGVLSYKKIVGLLPLKMLTLGRALSLSELCCSVFRKQNIGCIRNIHTCTRTKTALSYADVAPVLTNPFLPETEPTNLAAPFTFPCVLSRLSFLFLLAFFLSARGPLFEPSAGLEPCCPCR